jgi:hypothetical protein
MTGIGFLDTILGNVLTIIHNILDLSIAIGGGITFA